ncbi:MAG: molybdenum cofactor guanylyltransferase MobA, partial [Rubrivivax sp.]|nr:molybdenum cofactor guanylyltransferase MobA [Rubrivivax sp.]
LAATRAADGSLQPQPVFCLMRCSLATSLAEAMAGGERRIDRWTGRQRSVTVVFDDDEAFFNANTLEDLQR